MCGSIAMMQVPSMDMDSFGGFLVMSIIFSFFFDGFVQYLSKIVLANQFCADNDNDAASVLLQVCKH